MTPKPGCKIVICYDIFSQLLTLQSRIAYIQYTLKPVDERTIKNV